MIYCSQYAARLMQRNGGGSIINLASLMGQVGANGLSSYAGSKAAVIGITQSLAKELATSQIRVNAIAPGFIDTDMAHGIPEAKFAERLASIAMGRIGSPDEVAKVALFLASDLASYVTGQTIAADIVSPYTPIIFGCCCSLPIMTGTFGSIIIELRLE